MLVTVLRTGLTVAFAMYYLAALAHDPSSHKLSTGAPKDSRTGFAFPLPEPGSYELPPIMSAAGGVVLDEKGVKHDLAEILHDRIIVLAFIYTRCGDVCPMASMQLSALQDLATETPEVARGLRLISMSFDPDYDTPNVMTEHARLWRSQKMDAPEWRFLTAPDRVNLAPLLVAYNQSIGAKTGKGSSVTEFYHIFRAFLIDRTGKVRNIYSLDFLDPKLVIADIKTLLLEEKASGK
jgi:protein SCO1